MKFEEKRNKMISRVTEWNYKQTKVIKLVYYNSGKVLSQTKINFNQPHANEEFLSITKDLLRHISHITW